MNEVYVYVLCHPVTQDVRYVGVTRHIEQRRKRHCRPDETYKGRWVQSLVLHGLIPKLIVVETAAEDNWQEREQFWIAEYKRLGARLTNGDAGGLGASRHTPELKAKISDTLKERGPNLALSKKIYSYDPKDGSLVQEYVSASEAARVLSAQRPNIVKATRLKLKIAGYFWSREKLDRFDIPSTYKDGVYDYAAHFGN